MKARTKILFKINNEVILEESRDLYLNQIDELKNLIAKECDCTFDEVEVERVEMANDISEDIDVSNKGMHFWKSIYMQPIQGVYCILDEGSDEHLDAINNGTIEEYLSFFI